MKTALPYFSGVGRHFFARAEELREQVRIPEALAFYDQAEAAGFNADRCAAARWTCLMLAGQWERAWCESDAIAARGQPDPYRFWDGSAWSGRDVLIRCLHGLGDTLQFVRYAPVIRETARTVTVEAQPKLKQLLQIADVADRVITWGEAEPPWQVQLEVNELPRIFRTLPETIPQRVPYLRPGVSSGGAGEKQGGQFRVGLVWAASDFDPSRSIPDALVERLIHLSGVSFCSLQGGSAGKAQFARKLPGSASPDAPVLEVAQLTSKLDLVLTVDTMNAHLAGALGVKTWTMLPFQCDWRWMMQGTQTAWYPTMRLFRQPAPGDWDSVLAEVRSALAQLTERREAANR